MTTISHPGTRRTSSSDILVALTFAGFVATVFAANWLTTNVGTEVFPGGPRMLTWLGVSFTTGTLAAGLSFGLRDACQEAGGRLVVIAAIFIGAALSYFVSPALAVASGVAFLLSESADFAVYTPLRERRWTVAVIASNLVGALVDTVIFLWLAGFPIRASLAGQMLGKAAMILPALLIVSYVRSRR